MKECMQCGKSLKKPSYRYCSNQCQLNYQYAAYIETWKNGNVNGARGINAKAISRHIRRYLLDKYSNRCSMCGWDKQHPVTKQVPLEIDHIDGNAENNREENLRLVCPNCHSLTSSFRNLNKGKGRAWRRLKYVKNI